MSESLSTLSAGSRWFENESSKWARHVSVPFNAGSTSKHFVAVAAFDLLVRSYESIGRSSGASQGSHMSGATSISVQMMTKPESEELRAIHVLIVADDERRIPQKLEVRKAELNMLLSFYHMCKSTTQLRRAPQLTSASPASSVTRSANCIRFLATANERMQIAHLSSECAQHTGWLVEGSDQPVWHVRLDLSGHSTLCWSSEEDPAELDAILSLSQALPRKSILITGRRCIEIFDVALGSALYAFDAEDPDFLARRMTTSLLGAPVVLESD
ncbi:hypothetical protein Esti_002923 [Eimeria stiedai]